MDDRRLDNPFWHALIGEQAHVAEGDGPARRYRPDVSVFYAAHHLRPAAWSTLADLAGAGRKLTLTRAELPDPPSDWTLVQPLPAHQMVLDQTIDEIVHEVRQAAALGLAGAWWAQLFTWDALTR